MPKKTKKLTAPVNVMVEEKVKEEATKVLEELGISMSMAITIYLKQIIKEEGIPFKIKKDKSKK